MHPPSLTTPAITHPETAWLVLAVPLWMTIAAILLFSLLLRGKLRAALHTYLEQRAAKGRSDSVPTALLWTPPVATEGQLLIFCLIAVLVVVLVLSTIVPVFIALVLAGPATAFLLWLLLWIRGQQYTAALDR